MRDTKDNTPELIKLIILGEEEVVRLYCLHMLLPCFIYILLYNGHHKPILGNKLKNSIEKYG